MIIGNISTINYDQHVTTTIGVLLLPALEYSNDTLDEGPSLYQFLMIILKNVNSNYLDNINLYTI